MLLEPGGWTLVPCIDDVLAGLPPSVAATPRPRPMPASWSWPRARSGRSRTPSPSSAGSARARRSLGSLRPAVRRRGHAPDRRVERRRGLARPPASGDQRLDAGARAARADVRAARARRRAGPRARGARAGRAARVPPAAAGALRQLAVLAGPRHRARLHARPDLLDVPALGHPAPSATTATGSPPSTRWCAAERSPTRASCGGTPGCSRASAPSRCGSWTPRRAWRTSRRWWRSCSRSSGCTRRAPAGSAASRPRRWPRTASSRPATGSTRSSSAASAGGGRAPPNASRACWRRAARSRTALGCLAELESAAELAESPGHARQRATAADRGLVGLVAELSAEYAPRAAQRARLS